MGASGALTVSTYDAANLMTQVDLKAPGDVLENSVYYLYDGDCEASVPPLRSGRWRRAQRKTVR